MLASDSQSLIEHQNQTVTEESRTASQPLATTRAANLDQEYGHTRRQAVNNQEKHWILDGNDITSLFLKYHHQADIIPKPVPLESNIQEILSNEQHSECKMAVFGELALNILPKYQTQALLCNLPHDAPSFINDDYLAMLNIVTAIDEDNLSPKRAKLQLLILASSMDQFKSNVVQDIADL